MWILRALAQFKGSERSPGLFQDFEDGYIKVEGSLSYCMSSVMHGVVVMTVGFQSGESQFETY